MRYLVPRTLRKRIRSLAIALEPTSLARWRWKRKFLGRTLDDIRAGFSNLEHPHRLWLVERLPAVESALEIGSGYGPNLEHLARRFPDARLVGLDMNAHSVAEGNRRFRERGVPNASLLLGNADDLSRFETASFDLVLADAMLLYVAPSRLPAVFDEMRRISRQLIAMVDLHDPALRGQRALGRPSADGWIRNWETAISRTDDVEGVTFTKIPPAAWSGGPWERFGYLMIVTIKESRSRLSGP